MIINPISKGGKGLLPEIIVTAPSGSTLDLMQGSVVLQTYTLSSTETQYTFTVKNTGTYTVRGTSGSDTASVEVVVDVVGRYECNINYYQYSDNGIIFRLDGIDNTPNGHSSTTTTWYDLIGGLSATINDCYINDDNIQTKGQSGSYIEASGGSLNSTIRSIDFYCKINGQTGDYPTFLWKCSGYAYAYNQIQLEAWSSYFRFHISDVSRPINLDDTAPIYNTKVHYCITCDGSAVKLYRNGELLMSESSSVVIGNTSAALRIGYNSNYSSYVGANIYGLRLYNRALTSEEVYGNYETDVKRFV